MFFLWLATAFVMAVLQSGAVVAAPQLRGQFLPTGGRITPQAMPGSKFETLNPGLNNLPGFVAGQAAATALSPNGKTLLVLTSGYNRNFGSTGEMVPELSNEYVFIYDVSGPFPVKRQVLQIPNTFLGLAWRPDNGGFFVAGGVDDVVYDYKRGANSRYTLATTIALGHSKGVGADGVKPQAARLAVSPNGKLALVTNYQNDSVSLIDTVRDKVIAETDLRPGVLDPATSGTAGGTYPNVVAFVSDNKAYVSSQRDRELITLAVSPSQLAVGGRMALGGQPAAIVVSRAGHRAYVALDNTDQVAVVDTDGDVVIETIPAAVPAAVWNNPQGLRGANTNGLALSPDGGTLFATNGGLNALAVIELADSSIDPEALERINIVRRGKENDDDDDDDDDEGLQRSRVIGLVPTGWYPTSVAIRPDGNWIYVVNGKSDTGPNPLGCRNTTSTEPAALFPCKNANQYVWQLEKAGLLTLPMPSTQRLADMTLQVAANNNFPGFVRHTENVAAMARLRPRIKHVIYIVKENRSYDQVLGDLEVGNGDPRLTLFPEAIAPNHHSLARGFVTLDAFFDSGEVSSTGWNWTTAARATDSTERAVPVNYAGRGLNYDAEGTNRGINVGSASQEAREAVNPDTPKDPNIMAGTADVEAPDAPQSAHAGEAGTGYLWDAALRQGLTVRNYGFYGDLARYGNETSSSYILPTLRMPFAQRTRVFFPTKASLAPNSDIYFRGYDQKFPDFWRVKEWEREFDIYAQNGSLPQLTLLRLPHDHFGSFGDAIDGVNTVETQMADNDYAVALVVDKVAHSKFAKNTLIFIIEDDAQDGADHVSAHRSIAFVAGPYVRHHAVVSENYTTVSMLKTIEDVLGLPPLGLNDGLAEPMAAIFNLDQNPGWTYEAVVPDILRATALPLPRPDRAAISNCYAQPKHDAAYWERAMHGQDFTVADNLDSAAFNAALWRGLKGTEPPK